MHKYEEFFPLALESVDEVLLLGDKVKRKDEWREGVILLQINFKLTDEEALQESEDYTR